MIIIKICCDNINLKKEKKLIMFAVQSLLLEDSDVIILQ